MLGFGGMYRQRAKLKRGPGIDPDNLPVPGLSQPLLHGPGCIDRHVLTQCSQRREREVIGMRMGDEHRIEIGQGIERNPGWADSPQESGERRIEVRIGENALPSDFEQQCRMADIRDTEALRGTRSATRARRGERACVYARLGTGAVFARSFAISHCCGSAAMFCTA